jgi:MYXO-CTERM domain-containing protein
VDKIIIDNSPGLGVALIGRPGSIGEVLVRNSPDIRLGDSLNAAGRTGAAVSFIDASSASSDALGAFSPSIHITPAIPGGVSFQTSGSIPASTPTPEPSLLTVVAACGLAALRRRPR